jgi:hypothetical protein
MPHPASPSSSPPRAIAISGILFSILFFLSLAIVRVAVPSDPKDPGNWLADPQLRRWIAFALNLAPFTGIAFLWFMAVLRVRIGLLEDRLFSTVFMGSGFLFVAMLFASVAVARGLLENFTQGPSGPSEAYQVGRAMAFAMMNTFAMKMAAVFIFATSSIGLRTKVLARWVSLVGFSCGIVLLLAIKDFAWIELLVPIWVLVVSLNILCTEVPINGSIT